MTNQAIEASNEDAASRLSSIREVMRRLVTQVQRGADSGEAFSVEALISDAADETVSIMTEHPLSCGCSPPWTPPRYRLPDDRTGVTGTLSMGERLDLTAWVNFYPDGNPAEIFVEKGGDNSIVGAYLDALAVAISIGLQYGVPWRVFAEKLRGWRFEPQGVTDDENTSLRIVASPLDYLFRWADEQIKKRAEAEREKKKDDAKGTDDD